MFNIVSSASGISRLSLKTNPDAAILTFSSSWDVEKNLKQDKQINGVALKVSRALVKCLSSKRQNSSEKTWRISVRSLLHYWTSASSLGITNFKPHSDLFYLIYPNTSKEHQTLVRCVNDSRHYDLSALAWSFGINSQLSNNHHNLINSKFFTCWSSIKVYWMSISFAIFPMIIFDHIHCQCLYLPTS